MTRCVSNPHLDLYNVPAAMIVISNEKISKFALLSELSFEVLLFLNPIIH